MMSESNGHVLRMYPKLLVCPWFLLPFVISQGHNIREVLNSFAPRLHYFCLCFTVYKSTTSLLLKKKKEDQIIQKSLKEEVSFTPKFHLYYQEIALLAFAVVFSLNVYTYTYTYTLQKLGSLLMGYLVPCSFT